MPDLHVAPPPSEQFGELIVEQPRLSPVWAAIIGALVWDVLADRPVSTDVRRWLREDGDPRHQRVARTVFRVSLAAAAVALDRHFRPAGDRRPLPRPSFRARRETFR